MPSHSVKQAKVMSAIAHGWHPSGLDIPVKVAQEFHAADAGHKYGKGMDKKSKALRETKHYRKARGGSIEGDGKDDVSYGGTLPRSLQPMTTHIPDSWLRLPRYADGGDIPDVGEPLIPSGGQFSLGTHLGNKIKIGSAVGEPPKWDYPSQRAGGGKVGNFDPERGAAIGLSRQGMIRSAVPGRTDKLNLNVPSGSYIIPADIPSALGQDVQ